MVNRHIVYSDMAGISWNESIHGNIYYYILFMYMYNIYIYNSIYTKLCILVQYYIIIYV